MKILCFDMGGTAVKYGVWDDEKITKTGSFKTPTTWDEMKQQMRQVATKFADVEGVGISSPGSVDSKLGVIRGISAIPYMNTALGIVHQCGTFVHQMRSCRPLNAKVIVHSVN